MVKNLTGQVFGRITVLGDSGQRLRGRVLWECRCSCGKHHVSVGPNLVNGSTKSCGCLRRELAKALPKNRTPDIEGKVFGMITVLQQEDHATGGKGGKCECLCKCGKRIDVTARKLINGIKKSCGCLKLSANRPHQDLTGMTVGRLTVIRETGERRHGEFIWLCQCMCGSIAEVKGRSLRDAKTLSCGCLMRETTGKLRRTHGLSETQEYKRFLKSKRYIAKMHRTPPWVDIDAVREVYINRPKGMTVDHIIPLQGELVSGLHVANNLQYLTLAENSRKHNNFTPFIRINEKASE